VTLTEDALLDPLFKGLESSFTAFHWHGDIFELPAGAVPLARSEMTRVQAFRHGTTAYGLLFHLEVDRAIVEAMVRAFPGDVEEAGLTAGAIVEGAERHLQSLSERAERVFEAWVDRVTAYLDAAGNRPGR
jgi:GMP synthase (glutamine-hydrolysing)